MLRSNSWRQENGSPGSLKPSYRALTVLLVPGLLAAIFIVGEVPIFRSTVSASTGPMMPIPAPLEAQLQDATVDSDVILLAREGDEAALSSAIVERISKIPENVRKPEKMTVKELQVLVDETLVLGDAYLDRFKKGEHRQQVLPGVARLWVLNNTRYLVNASQAYREKTGENATSAWRANTRKVYFARAFAMIEEALGGVGEDAEMNLTLHKLKGQALWFANNYSEAIGQYRLVLALRPEDGEADQTLCALVNAQLKNGDRSDSVASADLFFENHPTSNLLPHVLYLRGKALVEAGRAKEALGYWHSITETIRAGAAGEKVTILGEEYQLDAETIPDFKRYHEEMSFAIGFLEFAMGNYDGAERSLREEIEMLQESQANNSISNVGQVFLNRTEKVYDSLVRLYGKPAPDLDLGDGWIDGVSLDPMHERGNVVVLLFGPFGNNRYEPILRQLGRLYQAKWHEGLRIAWVTVPKGRRDLPRQMNEVHREARRLGLGFPVGLDLLEGWPVHDAYNASVGGATLVVIDRAGNYSWYKMDPTQRDASLLEQVLDRLLGEGI